MKNFKLKSVLALIAVVGFSTLAFADYYDFAYKSINEFPTITGAPATGDYEFRYVAATNKVSKILSTGNTSAGSFNGTVGATTPSTGAFTTLSASGDITATGGVDGVVGGVTPAAGSFTTLTASTAQTDHTKLMGANSVSQVSAGTWTLTRTAEATYAYVHTAAANTTILTVPLSQAFRTTASKGVKITSLDVLYSIGTLALNAHTMTLDSTCYTNNSALVVTSVPLTGSLATATQASPYVTNITVTTPAFENVQDCEYWLEITVNAAATSAYSFLGVALNYSEAPM